MEEKLKEIEELLHQSSYLDREQLVMDIYAANYLPKEEMREILGVDEESYQEKLKQLIDDELNERFYCLPKAFKSRKIVEFKKEIGG